MFLNVLCVLVFYQHVVAQNDYSLSTVLSSQPQLTNFTALLSLFPALLTRASVGNLTILAPSNEAFTDYLTGNSNFTNDTGLNAILSYHIIQGVYTPVEFETDIQFLPTLLTDPKFSNVTGGQRVGVYPTDQGIVFESGIKSRSKLTFPNIIYASTDSTGVIHIIDKMLEIPRDVVTTKTEAGLDGVIASTITLPVSPNISGIWGAAPGWTLFSPNSTDFNLTETPTDAIYNIEEYHLVFGHVFYSPDLKGGLQIQSLLGPNLTVTVAPNGTRYINDAEIISSDFLINVGVLHVLKHSLSPNKTDARPDFSVETETPAASTSSDSSSSLSTAAKTVIGVGAGIVALLVIGALCLLFRYRRIQKSQTGTAPVQGKHQYASEMPHPDRLYSHEMDAPAAGVQQEPNGHGSRRGKPARFYEMQ